MDNSLIEGIIQNLFYVLPALKRKLLRVDLQGVCENINLSLLHLGVMGMLIKDTLPISEIARRLLIPRPEMTRLINRLISSGMVAGRADARDRRVTNIALTDSGRVALKECKELLKNNIRQKLSHLSHKELEELSVSLTKLRDIGSRLE